MQKVIVLGANGFIGTNLTRALSSRGIEVVALVDGRFDYSFLKQLPCVHTIEFSLAQIDHLNSDNRIKGAELIYHFAWDGVNAQMRNDAEVQASNIIYGLKVLEFAKTNGINKVLIPGSAAEVSCGKASITGEEVPAPSDLYSAAKVATRYMCLEYARRNDITLIWTLITSIYGPGRDDNNLLSYAIKSLLKGEKPSFTKLEQQWDYLYIDDLMSALIALGEKGTGGVYPLGSGEHRVMSDFVNIIRNIINPELPVGVGDLPYKNPNTIDNQIMDISKLKKETGFVPKYGFEEGITNTINYFRQLEKA